MFDLKQMRAKLGLSQMRLSKLAGVSRYRVHLFENKYAQLTAGELKKIKTVIKTGVAGTGRKHGKK